MTDLGLIFCANIMIWRQSYCLGMPFSVALALDKHKF